MRYAKHGKHKQVSFDRVVLVLKYPSERKLQAEPYRIDILGSKPFDWERGLWASDHFGLVACIGLLRENSIDVESEHVNGAKVKKELNCGYATP